MGIKINFQRMSIIFIIFLFFLISSVLIFNINSTKFNNDELHILWSQAKNNDRDAASQLLLFYTSYNFDDNLEKIAKLKKILLEPNSRVSCFLYGKFMIQFFEENTDEFTDGILWLKKAKELGSEKAVILLDKQSQK